MEGSPAFGQGLKQRRTALGLSQRDLAARVGCSAVTIRKFESGDRRPSWQLAGLLAGALEIPEPDRPAFVRAARAGSPGADGPPSAAPAAAPDVTGKLPEAGAPARDPAASPPPPLAEDFPTAPPTPAAAGASGAPPPPAAVPPMLVPGARPAEPAVYQLPRQVHVPPERRAHP